MKRRLPAEWEPQDGILLAWPHADSDWSDNLEAVEQVFVTIAAAICRFELVLIVAPDTERVKDQLSVAGVNPERIRLFRLPTNDTWARDFGPITVLEDGTPLILDFGFNAWGLKFAADLDNLITGRLARLGAFGATPLQLPGTRTPLPAFAQRTRLPRSAVTTLKTSITRPLRRWKLNCVSCARRRDSPTDSLPCPGPARVMLMTATDSRPPMPIISSSRERCSCRRTTIPGMRQH